MFGKKKFWLNIPQKIYEKKIFKIRKFFSLSKVTSNYGDRI